MGLFVSHRSLPCAFKGLKAFGTLTKTTEQTLEVLSFGWVIHYLVLYCLSMCISTHMCEGTRVGECL